MFPRTFPITREFIFSILKLKKKLYSLFLWMGFNCLKAGATSKRQFTIPQKFMVLILSTSEGWKAESILEPPSGFEQGIPGLGI